MKVKVQKIIPFSIYSYEVKYIPNLHIDENTDGYAHHRKEEIGIDPVLSINQKNQTLFHEMGEIIRAHYSVEISHTDLDRMALGYCEFLKNLGIELDWVEIR